MAKPTDSRAATMLLRSSGQFAVSVIEYVADIARDRPPALAWADPVPTARATGGKPGRHQGFKPLVCGAPNWPIDLPLAEVRLFWSDSALHVVADEGRAGGRWARIQEQRDNQPAQGETVSRSVVPVLSLRDRERFGLSKGDVDEIDLLAVEYRRQGRLLAWRLVPKG